MAALYLVPIALVLGLAGLAAFMWALGDGQYEDLDGAAERVLLSDTERPIRAPSASSPKSEPLQPEPHA